QWFISMDQTGLRQRALDSIERVTYYPEWGRERMRNVVKLRPDWCISRQRTWGVPITAFYCSACEGILYSPEVIEHVAGIFEREGADAWYARPAEELAPPGSRCLQCGGQELRKETDILDVWLDSGTSSIAVLQRRGLPWPADVYLEGGDQFRAWFNSSLMVGIATRGEAPYRNVIAHGWTVDAQGNKMSKSKGNTIEPQDVIKHHGAEILRLWVAASDYHEEVRISEEILTRLVDAYRKIRNTACYLVNNLTGFDPERDRLPYERLREIDRWILAEWAEAAEAVQDAYRAYEFHLVYQRLYAFCSVELSAVYFDILKDRLYTAPPRSDARRSAQTALYYLLRGLTTRMAPILAFTADEIWPMIPGQEDSRVASVHIAEFDAVDSAWASVDLLSRWRRLMTIRGEVLKALEVKRAAKMIGSGLEARVKLKAGDEMRHFLLPFADQLAGLFIVSQAVVVAGESDLLVVDVARAEGTKCERCWNYRTSVGESPRFPVLCDRCVAAVREIEEENDRAAG
ncbi:MAG: class I tRNA ligase family protein, partial [Acidobacteria bacterium]|nr:class I tRNA ligase family protein [Acidobacteriota bacterium]